MWIAAEAPASLFPPPPGPMTREATLLMQTDVLYLIGCGVNKREEKSSALNLYTSKRFHIAAMLANRAAAPIYILSGKYGVVKQTKMLAPYNLNIRSKSLDYQIRWASKAISTLREIAHGKK